MATTEKLGLPLIEPNMTADVPRDMNALAEAVDAKVGVAGGLAVLGADGKVPADQLNVKDPVDASLTQKGIVQLTNATNNTSETLAPTAKALKTVADLAAVYGARGNVPADWNTALLSGNYNVGLSSWTGYSGYPSGAYTYGKLVVHYNGGACVQTYTTHDNPARMYIRSSFSETNWRPWVEVITSNNAQPRLESVRAVEIGTNVPGAGPAFIDFHSGAAAIDYDVRILASGGNGTSGQGILEITASNVHFTTSTGVTTLNDLKQSVVDGKSAVAGAINGKGGNASGSNTFAELAAAITNLPVKRFASGTFNGQSAQATSSANGVDMTVSVALPFTVTRVFIRVVLEDTQGTSTSRQVDGVVMTSSVFNDNKSAKGWRNNYVNVGYLEPPIQGFSVKLSGSRIDAYAGGNPIAKISAYEWWAYE
ncbi:hypothetical protein ABH897_003405 [Paenibacillus sp. RC73]|uniref:pyocin knob domain-containing protein n=1 Tax=Paenibacillus sp. RC73 TaxID=3156250 RepID=UPI003837B0C9